MYFNGEIRRLLRDIPSYLKLWIQMRFFMFFWEKIRYWGIISEDIYLRQIRNALFQKVYMYIVFHIHDLSKPH